jgi:hypothetical protein
MGHLQNQPSSMACGWHSPGRLADELKRIQTGQAVIRQPDQGMQARSNQFRGWIDRMP